MRINSIKINSKTFKGQANTPANSTNTTQNNTAQKPSVEKSNPLKKIPTQTYIYSAAAIGIVTGGLLLHHHIKANPKKVENFVEKNHLDDLEQEIKEEIIETKPKETVKPKINEEVTETQHKEPIEPKGNEEITEAKNETIVEKEPEKSNVIKPVNVDFIDDTFKKLETNTGELKKSFNTDNAKRQEFFKDFDNALDSKDKTVENKVFKYLTNPNNSRDAQDLIYSHMENDYKPTFDSLVDTLHKSDAGRTYIPTLRVIAKRGNEKDIKEIQTIMQTPNTASMIYTNIAVSYTKLPKERFDKDIVPIFDGLYADKKVALLQVFETHKSKEYVPLIDSMRGIQGYESYIYPQIDHAKQSCQQG